MTDHEGQVRKKLGYLLTTLHQELSTPGLDVRVVGSIGVMGISGVEPVLVREKTKEGYIYMCRYRLPLRFVTKYSISLGKEGL